MTGPAAPPSSARAPLPDRLAQGDWWKEEDLPLEWGRWIPDAALHVEIGFGEGEFLLWSAARHPGEGFVGVERYAEGHRALVKSAARAGLGNVLSMVGDAYILMNLAFADASLDSVTVNFPDPWPKARHARRRLLSREFFGLCARKLHPGGLLRAATDDRPLAEQAAGAFAATPDLVSSHPEVPWLDASPNPVRTRYETKWLREGRPLHYFLHRRREVPCPT